MNEIILSHFSTEYLGPNDFATYVVLTGFKISPDFFRQNQRKDHMFFFNDVVYENDESDEGIQFNGKEEGFWITSEQRVKLHGFFKNGLREGVFVGKREDGSIVFKGHFLNGAKDGQWIYYYLNGKKESQGSYTNNKAINIWYYWDQNGKMTRDVY